MDNVHSLRSLTCLHASHFIQSPTSFLKMVVSTIFTTSPFSEKISST